MLKVTTADVIRQLAARGVFTQKKVGTREQQEQINAALTDLVKIGDRWNEA